MLRLILAATLCLAAPVTAQTTPLATPAAPPAPVVPSATVRVALVTSEGTIVVALEKDKAPVTTANFLRYVDGKRFDGTSFYRAVPVAADPPLGFIQGGVRYDPKRVLKPIAHEPTSQTGLSHVDGAISMARHAPGTATGDFFITVGALPSMDADPSQPGDNAGFAVFGRVVEGMDVVRRMLVAPPSPDAGEGVMKGQMLAAPIRIVSARRVN